MVKIYWGIILFHFLKMFIVVLRDYANDSFFMSLRWSLFKHVQPELAILFRSDGADMNSR